MNKQYHSLIKLFEEGSMLCNNGKVYEAHKTWEHIWKEGDEEIRENIKGFIQLSAGVLKYSQGKYKTAEYLFIKAQKI